MQILHWLFKRACEEESDCKTSTPPAKREVINDEKAIGKDIAILHKHHRANQRTKRTEGRKHGCNKLKVFAFICGKDLPKECFYRTLCFNRLGNLNRRKGFVNSVKMMREESFRGFGNGIITKKENSAAPVGKKVLPVTEASLTTTTEGNHQCRTKEIKEQDKGSKNKSFSRMKELIRWAASAKTEKKGKIIGKKALQIRKQGTIKEVPSDEDDKKVRSESSNMSLTWDVESNCYTNSSVYSSSVISTPSLFENEKAKIAHSPTIHRVLHQENGHITHRTGNWITTDSEFVVLEL